MNMKPSRRLSEAVGSHLHLEFCCNRAKLFSESALKACVGQVLSTFSTTTAGALAHASYAHPALANPPGTQGTPAIDYAVFLDTKVGQPKVEIAVETKWAGSSHCSEANIVKDLIRLQRIKETDQDTVCIFLLAGSSKSLKSLFKKSIFSAGSGKPGCISLGNTSGLDLKRHAALLPANPGISATKIRLEGNDLHPKHSYENQFDFQAIAWTIG